jgi:hypothetical protein
VKIRILLAAAAAGALMTSHAMAASLLNNGGFENLGNAAPQYWGGYTFGPGFSPVLPGWTVDFGSVDVTQTGSTWGPAFQGTNSLDINGWEAGQISQSFATTAGKSYHVSLVYSRNPAGAPDPAQADVRVGNFGTQISAPNDPLTFGSGGAMKWLPASFDFIATGSTSTLTLTAITQGNGGVFFDDVSVTPSAVPEPATWAMMLAGFGGLGAAARMRRRTAAAAPAA